MSTSNKTQDLCRLPTEENKDFSRTVQRLLKMNFFKDFLINVMH